MIRILLITILLLNSSLGICQVRVYNGSIDNSEIQLTTFTHPNGSIRAVYSYNKSDKHDIIRGRKKNDSLFFIKKNDFREVIKSFEFYAYNPESDELHGKFINYIKQKTDNIHLTKLFEFKSNDNTSFENKELIQPKCTNDNYFRLLISKEAGEKPKIKGVRIYEMKTDRLIQEIELECEFWNLNSIATGDYNFDGLDDFSVFEKSHEGSNTSRLYILKIPNSEKYMLSTINGISLQFDSDSKLIHEHQQYNSGSSNINNTYRLVDNKMELVKKECMQYSNEAQDFVNVSCEKLNLN